MTFGLPTRTIIHDNEWVRPPGNTDFRVTKTAAQHLLTGPAAIDIGDGAADADDLIAPHAGTVTKAATVGSANLEIGWTENGVQWLAVLAHNLLPHPVRQGQSIALGQLVGHIGSTGATAAHLHLQIGYLSVTSWVWVDPWPLINQEDPMPGFKATGPPIGTFKFVGVHALISPSETKVIYMQNADAGPFNVYAKLALKTPAGQPVDIAGNSPPLPGRDQVYLVDGPGFGVAAYALPMDGTFTPAATADKAAHDAAAHVADAADAAAHKYP